MNILKIVPKKKKKKKKIFEVKRFSKKTKILGKYFFQNKTN